MTNYRRNIRRQLGFSIIETAASLALMAVLLSLLAQMTVLLKQHTAQLQRRDLVLVTLENILEESSSIAWDDLDEQRVSQLSAAMVIRQRWPQSTLTVSVDLVALPAPTKRVSIEVHLHQDRTGRPVRLVGWMSRPAES